MQCFSKEVFNDFVRKSPSITSNYQDTKTGGTCKLKLNIDLPITRMGSMMAAMAGYPSYVSPLSPPCYMTAPLTLTGTGEPWTLLKITLIRGESLSVVHLH